MTETNNTQTENTPASQPPKKVAKHSLCLTLANGQCVSIIPKGMELPVQRTIVFCTTETDQDNMCVDLRLGESKFADENYAYSKLRIDNIAKGAKGASLVTITFRSFENSVYDLTIKRSDSDPGQMLTIFPSFGLTEKEVHAIHKKLLEINKNIHPRDLGTAKTIIPLHRDVESLID